MISAPEKTEAAQGTTGDQSRNAVLRGKFARQPMDPMP
jgi:hypothetical protein